MHKVRILRMLEIIYTCFFYHIKKLNIFF